MSAVKTGAAFEQPVTFSQEDFDLFARLSGDDNPIHIDPDFAASTHFGYTVAHGMMLFGVLSAAVSRWLATPMVVHAQELKFPAPTYANRPHRIRLEVRELQPGLVRIGQAIISDRGTETALGEALVGKHPRATSGTTDASPPSEADEYKGLRLGMTAQRTRTFSPAEVETFCTLVGDPNPRYRDKDVVPAALIGGTVSRLLGVDLPGPGSNWLKQRYEFSRPVETGEAVTTEVEVVRFRPDKDLVNLSTICSVGGAEAMRGNSLVHAQDVSPRD